MCVCECVREAIGSLMGQVQELRFSCSEEEARVNSLRRELQDTSRELSNTLSNNNRQVLTTYCIIIMSKCLYIVFIICACFCMSVWLDVHIYYRDRNFMRVGQDIMQKKRENN